MRTGPILRFDAHWEPPSRFSPPVLTGRVWMRTGLRTGSGFQPAGENRPTLELSTVTSSYGTVIYWKRCCCVAIWIYEEWLVLVFKYFWIRIKERSIPIISKTWSQVKWFYRIVLQILENYFLIWKLQKTQSQVKWFCRIFFGKF